MTDPIGTVPWKFRWLFGCHLAAALLLGSWLLPASRAWWDGLDRAVFHALNGSLAAGGLWQGFWAIANWRPFDLVAGGVLLFLLWRWLRSGQPARGGGEASEILAQRLAAFAAFALLVVFINLLFQQILHLLEYRRVSPSGVLPGAVRLSETVTWIRAKDYSGLSFPSDHGFVLIAAVVYFWNRGGRALGGMAALLLAPFVLPRLVSGGHWLTDTLVGAAIMALVGMSWWFATPAHGVFAGKVYQWGRGPLRWVAARLQPFVTGHGFSGPDPLQSGRRRAISPDGDGGDNLLVESDR